MQVFNRLGYIIINGEHAVRKLRLKLGKLRRRETSCRRYRNETNSKYVLNTSINNNETRRNRGL